MAMLPPMLQISNDDGSGGYHRPCSATAFLTSALSRPGWTTAVRVTGSTVMSRIFSVDSTMPPSTAVAPPDSPVPIPRGTTAIRLAVAHRRTVCTSSVRRRPDHGHRGAGVGIGGPVLAIGLQNVRVGDDGAVGKFGSQAVDH